MARKPDSCVTPGRPTRFRCEFAGARDDAELRALLRAGVMRGQIDVTLEREPSFHRALAIEGDRHHAVVVRDAATAGIVYMGTRSVRRVWFNGRPHRVGYLGALRTLPGARGIKRLASGYRVLETTRRPDELPFDLTSVAADNVAARRLFERRLPMLPRYRAFCDYHTLLIPIGPRCAPLDPRVEAGRPDLYGDIADCLARNLRYYQLAPVWTENDLRCPERSPDLNARDFLVIREHGRVVACGASWDQRRFKQVVVRGYAPMLGRVRPLLNLYLGLRGQPRLPATGSQVPIAYLSHFAFEPARPDLGIALIRALRGRVAGRGPRLLAIGFAAGHPLVEKLRREFPVRTYVSRIFCVQWHGSPKVELDARIPHLEVATL